MTVFADSKSNPDASEKLQKVLARMGLGPRRTMEEWIKEGRVSVDGHVAVIGERVTMTSHVCVNGRPVQIKRNMPLEILLYHKPLGEVCSTKDEEGMPSVFRTLPQRKEGRWISVGRLDVNTSGLLLFTNNGELANALMHPSSNIPREYMARVGGTASEEMLQKLKAGVVLPDGMGRFATIEAHGESTGINHWYRVTLSEGRNRLVRRLWLTQGLTVNRLTRIKFGPITLPKSLNPGQWIKLAELEIKQLTAAVSG